MTSNSKARGYVMNKPTVDELASVGNISNKSPEDRAKHRAVVMHYSWRRLKVSWEDWQRVLGEVKADRIWERYPSSDAPCGSLEALLRLCDIDPNQALDQDKGDVDEIEF